MKTLVQCGCGSAFNAPASLVGQVVKCPACGEAMTVPDPGGEVASPAMEQRASQQEAARRAQSPSGLADIAALEPGQGRSAATAGFARKGSAAMRSGVKPALGGDSSTDIRKELCPRCQSVVTEAGRLCTTCLYELHTGQHMGARGRFRFTLGLAVAIAVLLLAAGVGIWLVTTQSAAPPAVVTPADSGQGAREETTANAAGGTVSAASRMQQADEAVVWEPGGASGSSVQQATITAEWEPRTGRLTFEARVAPRSGASLSMGTAVVLYRGVSEDGPFTQVDTAAAHETDGGALIFRVFDETAREAGRNQLHYRIAGVGARGERLFDTPAAAFPVVTPPRVEAGRLVWQPVSSEEQSPTMRAAFVVSAPGWEEVLVAEATASGPLNIATPVISGLPLDTVVQFSMPTQIEVGSSAGGRWVTAQTTHAVRQAISSGDVPAGVLPRWRDGRLTYQLLPDGSTLRDVREDAAEDGGAVLAFRVGEQLQTLALPAPPMVRSLTVTPFDRSVRLTWDNRELLAGREMYAGEVRIGVFRQAEGGPRQLLAMTPPEQTSFVDTTAANGVSYRYDVELTAAVGAAAPPLMRAQAFLTTHGAMPVLTPVTPRAAGAAVTPEDALAMLGVAIGPSELAHPYTCEAATTTLQAIRDALRGLPGVAIIERDELMRGRAATGGGLFGPPTEPTGLPAHLQFRIIDRATPTGAAIELWALDLVTGDRLQLASQAAGEPLNPAMIERAVRMASARQPEVGTATAAASIAPSTLVFGPLAPLDQPYPYLRSQELMADLAQKVARKASVRTFAVGQARPTEGDPLTAPGAVLISGRAWRGSEREPAVLLQATDAATGLNLGSFSSQALTSAEEERLAAWCAALTVPPPVMSTTSGQRSRLLAMEAASGPLHPVWVELADTVSAPSLPPALPSLDGSRPTTTFHLGLAPPETVHTYRPASRREPTHPLASVRPYLAAANPPHFDAWVAAYAQYIPADFETFHRGLAEVVGTIRSQGSVTPRFIIRGQEIYTGSTTLSTPVPISADPMAMNLRSYFPMGVSGQPIVQYRGDLEATFTQRPYAASLAWRQAPRELAEPFLRGVVAGVSNDSFERIDMNFRLPPDLHKYLAAVALADFNNSMGVQFKRRAVETAATVYREVQQRGLSSPLTLEQSRYVTNALLILLYENDPVIVGGLRNPALLGQLVRPSRVHGADVLRLLVDRVGPPAWEWAEANSGLIDWSMFLWRNADEMRLVTDAMPQTMPRELYAHVRTLLGAPLVELPDRPETPRHHGDHSTARPPFPGSSHR